MNFSRETIAGRRLRATSSSDWFARHQTGHGRKPFFENLIPPDSRLWRALDWADSEELYRRGLSSFSVGGAEGAEAFSRDLGLNGIERGRLTEARKLNWP